MCPICRVAGDSHYRAVRRDVLPNFECEQFADSDSRPGQKNGDHPVDGALALGENGFDIFRLQVGCDVPAAQNSHTYVLNHGKGRSYEDEGGLMNWIKKRNIDGVSRGFRGIADRLVVHGRLALQPI